MHQQVRDNVTSLTAVLTVVSLALVFAAVGRVVPAGTLPRAPAGVVDAIPHVNAAISLLAIGTIATGVRAIRRSNVVRHRRYMLASFLLFATFLVLYLYKVALDGPTTFPGEGAVETFVYFPVLAVHILLAIVALPAVYYVLLLAYSYPIHELSTTAHPRVGRVAATLWLVSFVLGEVVYVMLYWLY
ncbi:MAG: putative membrane protein [Halobacteriales archaeon]|jgi:putative membrane protein